MSYRTLAMAVDTLMSFTQDEIEYARMTSLISSKLEWQTGIADAKREGRNEGITVGLTKGRKEANLENARKMKDMGFMVEQIQAITGLSLETITQL